MTVATMRVVTAILAIAIPFVLALASNAAIAQAEIREGTEADPMDAAPTLSGVPNNPDIESATVAYDTSGSIRITVNFYHPFNGLDTSENYAFFTDFSIGEGEGQINYSGEQDCLFAGEAAAREGQYLVDGATYGSFTDYSFNGSTYRNSFSIHGLTGESQMTVSVAQGNRSVTAVGSAPSLAGRDYRCFELGLRANKRSYASNLYSTWDEGCGCWAVTNYLDNLGVADSGENRIVGKRVLWFNGFAPPPPPPPTAPPEEPSKLKLTKGAAVSYMKKALQRRFKRRYAQAYPQRIKCEKMLTISERTCSIFFEYGALVNPFARHPYRFTSRWVWKGRGRLWLTREGSRKVWDYALRLRRIDYKCAKRRSVKRCTKRLTVKHGVGGRA